MFADLYIEWNFLVVCAFSVMDGKVVMIVSFTLCGLYCNHAIRWGIQGGQEDGSYQDSKAE
jgi:hypothetical protein